MIWLAGWSIAARNNSLLYNKLMRNITIYIITIAVLLVGGIFLLSKPKVTGKNYDDFAKCLADKKLTMYGAYWCPHCQAQKKLFGDAFQYVPYVECTTSPELCTQKGVNGYPTWIDASGRKYEGEQELEKLSQISGCGLP